MVAFTGQRLLQLVLWLNALSAIGGGTFLMSRPHALPLRWLATTDFTSYYFPGVILFALVGGSAVLAALAVHKRAAGYQLAAILSGIIMLCWIIGEIVSIRTFHWLQVVYGVSGLVVVWLGCRAAPTAAGD